MKKAEVLRWIEAFPVLFQKMDLDILFANNKGGFYDYYSTTQNYYEYCAGFLSKWDGHTTYFKPVLFHTDYGNGKYVHHKTAYFKSM